MTDARILVVDDEESLRLPLHQVFQTEGFETCLAGDGREALEVLKTGQFQVMLTDLMMPRMDGIELMEHAHAIIPDLVVIVMTGFGTIETAIKALKGGAYDYILKPFKLDEILHVVRRALEQLRLQRENVQLNELNRRLSEIDQIKSNLLRAISHEFRTPLTVIHGWTDLLMGDSSCGQNSLAMEGLKAIKESSFRLGRMISNLLEYVGLTKAEGMRLAKEKVEILPLLEEAVQQSEEEAKQRSLTVVKSVDPDLSSLLADPGKMKILIFNLLDNAIKFNESGGRVEVEAQMAPSEGALKLRITNTKGEIPPDRLSELMRPFTQADMSVTRPASGLGLGLAVAKGIAEAHEGKFRIWSEKGKGSTAEILFPLPDWSPKDGMG